MLQIFFGSFKTWKVDQIYKMQRLRTISILGSLFYTTQFQKDDFLQGHRNRLVNKDAVPSIFPAFPSYYQKVMRRFWISQLDVLRSNVYLCIYIAQRIILLALKSVLNTAFNEVIVICSASTAWVYRRCKSTQAFDTPSVFLF
jgi:hypothetical protein